MAETINIEGPFPRGNRIACMYVNDREVATVLDIEQFVQLAANPRLMEGKALLANQHLRDYAEARSDFQRKVEKSKGKNVPRFKQYWVRHGATGEGYVPPVCAYVSGKMWMKMDPETGFGFIVLPYGTLLIMLDGDTQTTAVHDAWATDEGRKALTGKKIKVNIVFDRTSLEADRIFTVVNSEGVKVNAGRAISGSDDEGTLITHTVAEGVAALKGKVTKERQLNKGDEAVVTLSALRTSVVCFLKGTAGVQWQTEPVDRGDDDPTEDEALAWFRAVLDRIDSKLDVKLRPDMFVSNSSVWGAIGVIGREALEAMSEHDRAMPNIRNARLQEAAEIFDRIDWTRNDKWLSAGAKKIPSKVAKTGKVIPESITLGGPKEAMGAVLTAMKSGALDHSPMAA